MRRKDALLNGLSCAAGSRPAEDVRKQGADEKIFTSDEEITGYWREMQSEDLHNLYPSPYIIRTISMTMSWAEHVAHIVTM
jgi:hypothetical protein